MLMRRLCCGCIRCYQKHISPHFPAVCRYRPTCSQYTLTAIERFGSVRGIWLGTLRILRCNPLAKGGWDPVPEKFHLLGRHRTPQPDPLNLLPPRLIPAPRTKYRGRSSDFHP